MRALDRGYTSSVDTVDEATWYRILGDFDDANIFQTWAYGVVTSGRRNLSHLLLKEAGNIVSVAQARIVRVPLTHVGIAYIRWGPLWRRRLGKRGRDGAAHAEGGDVEGQADEVEGQGRQI